MAYRAWGFISFTLVLASLGSAQSVPPGAIEPGPSAPLAVRPNILLIIADDLGVDIPSVYGEHPSPANTPNIDALAADGILFRNAWSNPVCSPTRATILTGRRAGDTGVGVPIYYPLSGFELTPTEPTIAEELGGIYHTAIVGKWHLSSASGSGTLHPLLLGFDTHLGPMDNVSAYTEYSKSTNGKLSMSTKYATTEQVDDALELIDSFQGSPWFLWLAFNASHSPLHTPPANLHTYELPPNVSDDPPLYFRAITEAMDSEIGRLLANIPQAVLDNTIVIFLGDNGTPPHVTTPPFDPDHAKWTVYEGGLNVPFIVKGPGVAPGVESNALIHTTDLFATILELAGMPGPTKDSISIVPYLCDPTLDSIRPWVYADTFTPNGFGINAEWCRAVRDTNGYKLIYEYLNSPAPTQILFFDIREDPFEQNDLMLSGPLTEVQLAAFNTLTNVMNQVDGK